MSTNILVPGKVNATDPSVTLVGYTDAARARVFHTGVQFVKSELSYGAPVCAHVGSVKPDYYLVKSDFYSKYKDKQGRFVLINGETYIPQASGAPPADDSSVVTLDLGFPVEVSSISIWSKDPLEYDNLRVRYSHDGDQFFTWGRTVSEEFDPLLAHYEGESPPSGLYKTTLTLSSTRTARYFRVVAYVAARLVGAIRGSIDITTISTSDLGAGDTITALRAAPGDISGFPSSSTEHDPCYMKAGYRILIGSEWQYGTTLIPFKHTSGSLIESRLTGITFYFDQATNPHFRENYVGYGGVGEGTFEIFNYDQAESTFFNIYNFAHLINEIDLFQQKQSSIDIWDMDGTKVATQTLEKGRYYDITFDKHYNTFVAIRGKESSGGTPMYGFGIGDDFDYSFGEILDITRWNDVTTYSGAPFVLNTASGTLDAQGIQNHSQLITNYAFTGDFDVDVDVGFNTLGQYSSTFIRAIEKEYDNVYVQNGFTIGNPVGYPEAVPVRRATYARKTGDNTGGLAYIYGLRLNDRYVVDGGSSLRFEYDLLNNVWTVTSGGGGTLPEVKPGQTYSQGPIAEMSIVHADTTIPANSYIELSFTTLTITTDLGADPWEWKLGLKKEGDELKCRYEAGAAGSYWVTFLGAQDREFNVELYANNYSEDSTLVFDNYEAVGDVEWEGIPIFSVETLDLSGDNHEVSGFSDSDGFVIESLDVANIKSGFLHWAGGKVQITTDQASAGNVYLKVGDCIYKYSKTALPLTDDDGSLAETTASGVIPEELEYTFGYNAYANAGLSYVEYDSIRDGVYVRTVEEGTLEPSDREVFLDIGSADYPFAWNVNDYEALYYVDSGDLKFFDMAPGKVAFCNVSGDEKIMSAGSGDDTEVRAIVTNVYGDVLSGKRVDFSVSAGDGSIYPDYVCTNASGIAYAIYTVGTSVGSSTITAVASDISC